MLSRDNTLILFGRSQYINEIKKYIPILCRQYHTIGCNYFVNSFPEIENVIFYDDVVPDVLPKHRIIANINYALDTTKKCRELLINHKNTEFYYIAKNFSDFSHNKCILHFCIHTPSIALNWAYLKGFKNVILAGVDLTLKNNLHFDKDYTPDNDGHDFNKSAIERAREHLVNVAQRYLNVYQMNPKSDMLLSKIRIQDII